MAKKLTKEKLIQKIETNGFAYTIADTFPGEIEDRELVRWWAEARRAIEAIEEILYKND